MDERRTGSERGVEQVRVCVVVEKLAVSTALALPISYPPFLHQSTYLGPLGLVSAK